MMGELTFKRSSSVTGGSDTLFESEDYNVSVTFSAPISLIVPGLDTAKVDIAHGELRAFGIGGSANISFDENTKIASLSGDIGVILGLNGYVGYDFNNWKFVGDINPQASFGWGYGLGALGMGVGGSATVTATSEGVVADAGLGFALVGVEGTYQLARASDFPISPFVPWDGVFDPIGDAVADLHEEFPNVPISELRAIVAERYVEHLEVNTPDWVTRPLPEAAIYDAIDPETVAGAELLERLQASDKYHAYITRHDPGSTEEPPTGGNDDHDDPVVTIGSGSSGPAGGPVPAADDPTPTGSVGPAGGPIPPSPPSPPPYLDPDVSAPQPVLLDLDGDGIEVVFGEDIYFDTDGFVEKTAWAAADDGFLVIDLNADGTRGAGDGVINQGAEIAFAAGPPEGDLGLRMVA